MSAAVQLLLLVLVMVVFWAIVMRPARNQQRAVQKLQRELSVGDEVILSAGIFGTVTSLEEARLGIEVAPGTILTVARQAVVRRTEDLPDANDDDRPGVEESKDETTNDADTDTSAVDEDRPSAG